MLNTLKSCTPVDELDALVWYDFFPLWTSVTNGTRVGSFDERLAVAWSSHVNSMPSPYVCLLVNSGSRILTLRVSTRFTRPVSHRYKVLHCYRGKKHEAEVSSFGVISIVIVVKYGGRHVGCVGRLKSKVFIPISEVVQSWQLDCTLV